LEVCEQPSSQVDEMTPLDNYMHAVRPFTETCFTITETYARFLQAVGRGEYSLLTSHNMTKPSSGTDKAKTAPTLETDAPPIDSTPVSKSFDPFNSWNTLASFIPAPLPPEEPVEADHSPVALEADVVSSAQAMLVELGHESEHVSAELADVEEKRRALAQNTIGLPVFSPLDAFRMAADMLATIARPVPTPTAGAEGEVIEAHAADPKSQPNSGTTQEAARRPAKNVRETRRTKAQRAEDKPAARRQSRSRQR
jgi:hypothetical protein